MMKWTSALEVGDEYFDRDHRQLIAMVNLLADAIVLGDEVQAGSLAADLINKAEHHCHRDEHYLAHGSSFAPAVDAHRRVGDLAAAVRLAVHAHDLDLAARLLSILELTLGQAVQAEREILSLAVH